MFMRKLGLRSTYSGYNYLASGIYLTLNDSKYIRNVTKTLYTAIALEYNVTPQSVEAALRTLITNYWNQNGDRILSSYVGYSIYFKPTTSEFIAIISDYLRDQ